MSGTGLFSSSPTSWDDPWRRFAEGGSGPERVRPLSKAAVVAFALGLVGAVPLGLLFGGIGLSATGTYSDRRGRGFAWAGIALSLVWAVALVSLVVVRAADGPSRGQDGAVTAAGTADAFDLQLGDCLQAPSADGDVTRVRVIPCASAHDAQVFAIVRPDAVTYDRPAIATEVEQACTRNADAAITVDDPFDLFYLLPSEQGWDGGQRIAMCLLRSDTPLTSSVVTTS